MVNLSDYVNRKFKVNGTESNKILLFDIDDTLLKSKAKVIVMKNGKPIRELDSQEFNSYQLRSGEDFDFSEFASMDVLDKSEFLPYWQTLKREYKKGTHIGIITARSNSELFHEYFKKHGIDIKKQLIFAINEPGCGLSGTIEERKAQAIEQLVKLGYKTFIFFDDNEANLKQAKELEKANDIVVHTVKA